MDGFPDEQGMQELWTPVRPDPLHLLPQSGGRKAEIGKPFPEEERLKEVRARLAEVNAELELDKSSDDIIDEPDSLDEGEIITEERKRKRSVC